MSILIRSIFGPPLPDEHRSNFIHLYFDIFWWGILNGSTISFLAIYASRINATPFQVGLLVAAPAIVNIFLTFPVTGWARGKSSIRFVRWSNLVMRLFYACLIPLPLVLGQASQVWIIILITIIMNIPGTISAVMGNVFIAEVVPPDWRSQVIGTRNALLALASMISILLVGWILSSLPFAIGYVVVFSIGFAGSMASVVHLFLIRPTSQIFQTYDKPVDNGWRKIFKWKTVKSPFTRVMAIMFLLHLSIYACNPIFPLYQVRDLNFTDSTISIGTAFYWGLYAIFSTRTRGLARRFGFKRLTGWGVCLTGLANIIFIFSIYPWIYIICQIVSGIGWAMVGCGLLNYLLEKAPEDNRPTFLGWFNMAMNGAMLIGGLSAGWIVPLFGLQGGMWLVVILRILASAAILGLG